MSDSEDSLININDIANEINQDVISPVAFDLPVLEKRRQMIQKKKQLLDKIGIADTIRDIKAEKKKSVERKKKVIDENAPKQLRHSLRLQGKEPEMIVTSDSLERLLKFENKDIQQERTEVDDAVLINSVDYWKNKQETQPYVTTGHFVGWIDPEVCKRHNLPASREEMIKYNSTHSDSTLGLNFKQKAYASLHTNPNCYFYRFCEPDVKQWTGQWTSEEIDQFMSTAREHGCGDQWGIFSTYVPHRVGYQCANFYRQYVLPSGLIADRSYFINGSGKAVFKG